MDKKQIIEKIDNMSIEEILYEDNQCILNEEFSFINEDLGTVVMWSLFGIISPYLINQRAQKYLIKGKKVCDRYEGKKKQKCLQDVKKVNAERKLQQLRKEKSKCKKIDDPYKKILCKQKFDDQIRKTKNEIKENRRIGGLFQPNGSMYDTWGHD